MIVLGAGVIVAGGPCTGKSSIIRTLIDALNRAHSGSEVQETSGGDASCRGRRHALLKFFPLSVDSIDRIFGCLDEDGDWKDGAVTAAWKKAVKVRRAKLIDIGYMVQGWGVIFCHILLLCNAKCLN